MITQRSLMTQQSPIAQQCKIERGIIVERAIHLLIYTRENFKMLDVKHVAQLEESLVIMHDKLSATIKALSTSKALDEQYWGAISIWSTDVFLVAERAIIANQETLYKICNEIVCKLTELLNSPAKPIIHYCEKLITWTAHALHYLEDSDNFNQFRDLLIPISETKWQDIASQFSISQSQVNRSLLTILENNEADEFAGEERLVSKENSSARKTLAGKMKLDDENNDLDPEEHDQEVLGPLEFSADDNAVNDVIIMDQESTSPPLNPEVKNSLETENNGRDIAKTLISLHQIITNAINTLSEELADNADEKKSESLFEYCLCAVGDIAFAAEMIDFDFVTNLCSEREQFIITQAGDPPALFPQHTIQCTQWLTELAQFIKTPHEITLAKDLSEFITDEAQVNELLLSHNAFLETKALDPDIEQTHQLNATENLLEMSDILNESIVANHRIKPETQETSNTSALIEKSDASEISTTIDLTDTTEKQSTNDEVSTILEILSNELSDLTDEMQSLINIMSAQQSDTKAQQQACYQYQALIARLADTCESLELIGLQKICSFIEKNLSAMLTVGDTQKQSLKQLFMLWPTQVQSYLESPNDDNKCLALISCLQHEDWLEPLTDVDARQILLDLSKEMTLADFFEDQQSRPTLATIDDISLQLSNDIAPGLIDAFFHESPKFACDLSQCISHITQYKDLSDNINAAQRFAHTLKGSANLIGVKGVANITHHMEDILEYLAVNQDDFPPRLNTTLQEAADCVETMLDSLQGKDDCPQDALQILQSVLDWANSIDANQVEEFAASFDDQNPLDNETDSDTDSDSDSSDDLDFNLDYKTPAIQVETSQSLAEETLNVPTQMIDNMFRMAGELSIMASQVNTGLEQLRRHSKEVKNQEQRLHKHRAELEDMVDIRRFSMNQRHTHHSGQHEDFDTLEMDQYDELHGSIHGFIETVVDSNEMTHMIYTKISALENLLISQQQLNSDLQQAIMHTRMVAVDSIVARLQRTVRQTCRQTNKNVTLDVTGEELLLDGEVLNSLVAPIMHLLRNAVDHGIETTADRKKAGKELIGKVALEFSRIGNNIVVRCSDDGYGLNYDRIRQIAIQNDLISESDTQEKHELARLILVSGFTTRKKVTQISGRGVGLEVVNSTIQLQGGSMNIGDNSPAGCIVSLRIPISLVTSHSIIVKNKKELFAIPSNSLVRIIPSVAGKFKSHNGKMTYQSNDHNYKVVSLAELLNTNHDSSPEKLIKSPTILLIKINHVVTAVAVEQVVSSANLVVKNMGPYIPTISGISGVSIMGDGTVVSIIDLKELIEEPRSIIPESLLDQQGEMDIEKAETPTVLVVDDSLSMRKALSQLVVDAGYQVETARDGVEAMNMIRKHTPSLVLSDMEMPRMTGLELTSQIRSSFDQNKLPVIMITSRSAKKHRTQAERAGVNEYITKPFSEDNLLDVVSSIIAA